ncbi:MAG: hypothetical protein IM486_07425 [Microcystis sp. M114S2]|uniref:hypothetical protein n=1 Tax=Microcystis TaxID=1125 RepID=UPI0015627F40|nr:MULTISPECIES: hypothetical protein [Microcystis]MCA2667267.1 hypothetical protein [Microcystis sp. M045S2]MCA2712201.1 hypothetical protein [Microcystis sp. M172S2]MCA2803913.1 hypothetical protein [Microcystis sp. M114S2]MCA2834714.1 hypothetical protein [Microcystis sp. M007S1]MCA2836626.1 hypothetical protein [Microcystis sp. M078S1]
MQVKRRLAYSSSNHSISLFKEEGDRCLFSRIAIAFLLPSFHPLKPLQVRA